MTIKSLLIGSAAALATATAAQAADAVVAADPEPVEYVMVCDTYGDGYFYIPGSETCLKISGYVQIQTIIDSDDNDDAEHTYEARLQFDASNDSELGTIASQIRLTNMGSIASVGGPVGGIATTATFQAASPLGVDRAYINIGDGNMWTVGLAGSPWDFSIVGEQQYLASGATAVMLGYTAELGDATVSLWAIDDFGTDSRVDYVGKIAFAAGDIDVVAAVSYDEDLAAGEMGAKINVSYMGFGAHAQYSENGTASNYNTGYEWVLGVGYGFDATDKLTVAVAGDYAMDMAGVGAVDDWGVSANFDYALAEGLSAALRITHQDGDSFASGATAGRLRLTRSF